jgi:nucleotide-binding universal stress UspA family protein
MVMTSVRRVLCAVDIDDAAAGVFADALSLCRRHHASLVVLHVVPFEQPFESGAMERNARLRYFHALAQAALVDIRVRVEHGDPASIIAAEAAERRVDLIVLGTSGRGTDRRASVVQGVLRLADRPTLLVPFRDPSRAFGFTRVVCAVDLASGSPAVVHAARMLAAPSGSRINLFHVTPGETGDEESRGTRHPAQSAGSALRRLQRQIPEPERDVVLANVAVGEPAHEISRAVRRLGAELLVFGVRPRPRSRPFRKTDALLERAICPLLAVPLTDGSRVARMGRSATEAAH